MASQRPKRFPDLERIYVTGESAGGWASFAWTAEIARRFPNAQVTGWADSSLHLLCPSSECDEALKTVSESWGAPNEFTEGGLWTTEALQPGWGLPEFLADTLKSFKGRVRFGIFTRTADEEQLLFWDLFGGLKDKWTEGLVSLLHSFERDASPALLRTFVSPGATHGIHRSEEVWTLQVQGIRFVEWLRDLGGCQAHAARVWDPAVGVAASYAAENASEAAAYSCAAPTTTPVPGDSSASSGAFPLMPLVALLVSCV
ncbi:unnamed protein product [Effrenium voratum]|nr:unnamed protein product [Effrenium voratum]